MADIDLKEVHDFLIEISQKAGAMITSAHPSSSSSGSKKNSVDLVTETDQKVEEMVSTALRTKYPSFEFLGEETYQPGTQLSGAPTFVVDPIDGTTNFVHGYPYVSISLGLAVAREPVVGVVYNPFTDVLYSAIRGRGAFRNRSTPLPLDAHLPALDSLSKAVVAIEWGSDRGGNDFAVKTATFVRLAGCREDGGAMVHALRSFGSAALNLCSVAEGGLDLYWEGGCWAWDVCAGWVILKEAGGMIVDGNPGNWHPPLDQRRYLALRSGATNDVVQEFWSHIQGQMSYQP